ncbi:MAG TPA: DUF3109 family protein [Bacteroidota bacterium]
MFLIDEAVIDDAIGQVSFRCDLAVCKGACCCIAGGRGAPLGDDEVQEIHRALPVVARYLSEVSLRVIEAGGPVEGRSGDYATTCIDERECVFVTMQDGIALCAFERAYRDGAIEWQKPLSCHLFPIRVSRSDPPVLRYEAIEECEGGRQCGHRERTPLFEFLRDSLVRRFGQAWYDRFRRACARPSL